MFEMESNIGLEMRMFEDTLTPTKVTAGVIFSNNESNWRDIIDYQGYDDDFIEFLGYIGNGVDISNFTGFAGDLDISNDALDGIYSVYARKDCYELMYHVSPLLSEKKRGVLSQENVMIVFHKGDNEINVSSISLKTQVIVIVKPLESTNYKIEVWHKNNLKDIEIEMPSEEFVIPKQYLKEFIITVCINAEHIATVSGVFASTFSKEREKLLIQVKKQLFESMPRHSLSKSKAILPSI
ncbi:Rap gtpase-activating protein [Entamoeba marina]